MKHNFGAGPCLLPPEVFAEASQAVLDFNDTGLSILEISHRSEEFEAVIEEAEALVRSLLDIPNDYSVMFLQGGGSQQFAMIPLNLLAEDKTAAYLDTGIWAKKAIQEAAKIGHAEVIASSAGASYSYIPKDFIVPTDAAYLHYTSNNTVYGTEWFETPKSSVPLVADMSSDIMSKQIDVSDFGLIYAGAQKNLGPAGVTVVIMKNELVGLSGRSIPKIFDYNEHIKAKSLYHTPPVFAIYVMLLNLRWLKRLGGIAYISNKNAIKAEMLYDEIDQNPLFIGTSAREDRSRMNITFLMRDKMGGSAFLKKADDKSRFLKLVEDNGIVGINGHRSAGGFRVSNYNALPISSMKVLVEVMQEFARKY
ncbi:3-phosphoserine/phosphohydroxythreonine transaminase [Pedobacter sp. V48]|uniref:3-phosphoserine/phosphohydroxythreonine transaminase n=1 Tax=Pedobacter sp. V48 TaxID=509635 RepID=UPI0006647DD5|nr:3-phosphoserine/phosphohydroxythreonine transaminase [Pedobacter sp. V48]